MLCESTSGYVYDFIIYTGTTNRFGPDFQSWLVSSQIVLTVMKPLFDKRHCHTVDNYYTSPNLADFLVSKDTDIYGTVRLHRKNLPIGMKQENLQKGEVSAYSRGKLLALKWKDKKDVSLLSSIHSEHMVDVEIRTCSVSKPKVVMDYNNRMDAMDRVVKHLSVYPTPRKRWKNTTKTFFCI